MCLTHAIRRAIMLTNPAQMEYMARFEQEQRLREAEQDRLARLALAARPKREPLLLGALDWLGQQLMAWGQRLQIRGGPESEACLLPAIDQCACC
jgi:hypothetical protein